MGTFAGYFGVMDVPEEKRKKFTERILKVFEQSGMMQLETVSMYGTVKIEQTIQ